MGEVAVRTVDPIFVSVKHAAQMLSVSPMRCYQLLDQGRLRGKYEGRRRLVYLTSVYEYAEALPAVPESA